MVHGILQFTPRIAFRYVLHRCESRDIRCRESYFFFIGLGTRHRPFGGLPVPQLLPCSLASSRAVFLPASSSPGGPEGRGRCGRGGSRHPSGSVLSLVQRSCFPRGNDNDPSAGSPTETLLRLLLPLNDKVQWTSRDVTGGEPPASPRSEHFTGPFNR